MSIIKNLSILAIFLLLLSSCGIINESFYKNRNLNKNNEQQQNIKTEDTIAENKIKDSNGNATKYYEYFANKDYKKTIELVKPIYTDELNNKTKFIYAESLRLTNQLSEANKILDNILSSDKKNINAIESLGLVYLQQNKLDKSINIFYQLLEFDATRYKAINALGVIYSIYGKNEEANSFYKLALTLSENNPSVNNNFGLIKILSNKIDSGIKLLKTAKKDAKNNDKLLKLIDNNLALAYSLNGDIEESKKILSKYYSEHEVLNNLGVFSSLKSDKDQAQEYFKQAIYKNPVYYTKALENLKKISPETNINNNIIDDTE